MAGSHRSYYKLSDQQVDLKALGCHPVDPLAFFSLTEFLKIQLIDQISSNATIKQPLAVKDAFPKSSNEHDRNEIEKLKVVSRSSLCINVRNLLFRKTEVQRLQNAHANMDQELGLLKKENQGLRNTKEKMSVFLKDFMGGEDNHATSNTEQASLLLSPANPMPVTAPLQSTSTAKRERSDDGQDGNIPQETAIKDRKVKRSKTVVELD